MLSDVIYFILGFITGTIFTILRGAGREEHYEATIEALEGQNKMLRAKTMPGEG